MIGRQRDIHMKLPSQQRIQATGIRNFTNQQHDQYVCDQCPNANELEPVIKADLFRSAPMATAVEWLGHCMC